jgi:hypothetical protein
MLFAKSCMRWHRHLKGVSHEREWAKSAENFGASPLKSDLSIDTTFSKINLAGQFLDIKYHIAVMSYVVLCWHNFSMFLPVCVKIFLHVRRKNGKQEAILSA